MILELKNINKTYVTKTGVTFRALSNVSTAFDDSGMIFLVGKSGSGKSTLLNVIGGLDKYDSGEILIAGKSSRKMRAQEVDSFRNTLVGFVFQEFNLIDTLTVRENVALALDMQSDNDKSKVDDALEKMGIADKASNKAKNVSGGQRQRVAIARALVKNPRILLADEPTGALDSATGDEIMREFKKISTERLVVVVTHDLEKAAEYGDRIIEMKDGKIYRDVRRKKAGEKIELRGVNIVSDTLVHVDKDITLSDDDIDKLNEVIALSGRKTFVNIDTDHRKIKALFPNLREAVDQARESGGHVREDDELESESVKEKFVPYKPQPGTHPVVEYKKSRMPTGKSIRMGMHNLNHKKGRLALTIIMSVMAFLLFGVSQSFAAYDINSAYTSTIVKENIQNLAIMNADSYSMYSLSGIMQTPDMSGTTPVSGYYFTRMKDSDLNKISNANPNLRFFRQKEIPLPIDGISGNYNISEFFGAVEISDVADLNLQVIHGSGKPATLTTIIISRYMAREILRGGVMPSNIREIADLIDKTVTLGGVPYTIGGIFESEVEAFDNMSDYSRQSALATAGTTGLALAFVKEGFFDEFVRQAAYVPSGFGLSFSYDSDYDLDDWYNRPPVPNNSEYIEKIQFALESAIPDGLVPIWKVEDIPAFDEYGYPIYDDFGYQVLKDVEIINGGDTLENDSDIFINLSYFSYMDISGIIDFVNDFNNGAREMILYFNNKPVSSRNFRIRGLLSYPSVTGKDYSPPYYSVVTVHDDLCVPIFSNVINTTQLLVRLGDNKADTRELVNFVRKNGFVINAEFVSAYDVLMTLLNVLKTVLLVISLIFAGLVIILLFNFISLSITLTRKQIGILRALGAKKSDTFKVYALEGGIVAVISLAITFSIMLIVAPIVNASVAVAFGAFIPLLVFGARVFLLTAALGGAIALVSVLIPLRKFNRITPIDAISDKS